MPYDYRHELKDTAMAAVYILNLRWHQLVKKLLHVFK